MSYFFVFSLGFGAGFITCVFAIGLGEKIIKMCSYLRNRNFCKLPFAVPFKYSLEPHSFYEYQNRACKEFLIKIHFATKLSIYSGRLVVGSKADGVWGFKSFEFEGIGGSDDVQLRLGTDLLKVNQEINTISDTFVKNGIKVTMTARLKSSWDQILKDVNNLSVLARDSRENSK